MGYADYTSFLIQWTEWISIAGLGANTILPAANAADYHLGAYASTGGVFIDPQEKSGLTGWTSAKLVTSFYE